MVCSNASRCCCLRATVEESTTGDSEICNEIRTELQVWCKILACLRSAVSIQQPAKCSTEQHSAVIVMLETWSDGIMKLELFPLEAALGQPWLGFVIRVDRANNLARLSRGKHSR